MKCKVVTATLISSMSSKNVVTKDPEGQKKLDEIQKAVESFFQTNEGAKMEWHQSSATEGIANWIDGMFAMTTTITVILTAPGPTITK